MEHRPVSCPFYGSEPHPDEMEKIAWVRWFAEASGGSWNTEIDCPQVSMNFRNDPSGNLWPCGEILPINICLSPCVLRNGALSTSTWQVLHRDSDFFKKDY